MELARARQRRRAFLKWAAFTAAISAGGYVKLKNVRELQRVKRIAEAASRKTHSTRDVGVSGVIESVPDIADHESSWFKPRAGAIREAHSARGRGHVESLPPLIGDRSHIHTHPYNSVRSLPKEMRMRYISNPSPGDVLEMLRSAKEENPVFTAHTAAVDEYGRVLGYTSIRIAKKIQQNDDALEYLHDIAERFDVRYTAATAARNWKRLNEYSEQFYAELESSFGKNGKMVKNGLLIHHMGMPGFEYRNREFKEK